MSSEAAALAFSNKNKAIMYRYCTRQSRRSNDRSNRVIHKGLLIGTDQ